MVADPVCRQFFNCFYMRRPGLQYMKQQLTAPGGALIAAILLFHPVPAFLLLVLYKTAYISAVSNRIIFENILPGFPYLAYCFT